MKEYTVTYYRMVYDDDRIIANSFEEAREKWEKSLGKFPSDSELVLCCITDEDDNVVEYDDEY